MTILDEALSTLQGVEEGQSEEFVRGYQKALELVDKVVKKYEPFILEYASETEMMFVDNDALLLKDKQAFVRNLGKIAAMTRDGVKGMELDDSEIVTVKFKGDGCHKVNINMDSYAAIIRDCGKAIN